MVKKSYEPVYNPGNYAFGRSRSIDNGAMIYHEVLISGRDGKDWTAIYQMMRQPDGGYKINGVQIVPNTDSKGISTAVQAILFQCMQERRIARPH